MNRIPISNPKLVSSQNLFGKLSILIMSLKVERLEVRDVRFPTSKEFHGSDASKIIRNAQLKISIGF